MNASALDACIEKWAAHGFQRVSPPGVEIAAGFAVLAKDGDFYGMSANGFRSMGFPSVDGAYKWVNRQALMQSDQYPEVGELWDYAGRTAIICGNTISDRKTIWVMDWNSGDRADAPVDKLEPRADRHSLNEEAIIGRFSEWARNGSPDAIWWLAWWFEGTNHPKSVWYYVAAMRADPEGHGWAHERIMDDAKTPCLCEGVVQPDLGFLKGIPEIAGKAIGSDWAEAVRMAEQAVHVPAKKPKFQHGPRVVNRRYHAPADVTTS